MNKSKKTKDYAKKFGQALKSIQTLEYKEIAIKTKDGSLKKVQPLDISYEG